MCKKNLIQSTNRSFSSSSSRTFFSTMAVQTYDLAEGLPEPKRLKSKYEPDLNAFKPGSIIRCKLTNFMSYALTEFHFGPQMNLIIGPNGSGKSTFVCAVCIGLGGKLSNLGKESMITDGFIKDNQNDSIIELELKNFENENRDSVTITTKLFRGRKTQWEINFNPVMENEIKKILKKFNIQLDNLCQFLPQDRVSKFADLKSDELLKEIERCYGNGELLEQHNFIIQLQNSIGLESKKLEESNEQLEEFKAKNELLKENVEKHKLFIKLTKALERFELIKPYVIYQDKKRERDEYYKLFESEKKEYKEFQERVKPIEAALRESDEGLIEVENKLKDYEAKELKYSKEINTINGKIKTIISKIESHFSGLKDYEVKLKEAKRDYYKYKDEFQNVNEDMSKIAIPDPKQILQWKEQRKSIRVEKYEIDDQLSNLNSRLDAAKRQIEKIASNINQEKNKLNSRDRLNTLDQRKYRDAINTIYNLRQLKKQGTDLKFFEPALIMLNVNEQTVAPIIEALVSPQNLTAVIVTTTKDFNGIVDFTTKSKCKTSVRTISDPFNYDNDRISRQDIIRLGFDGFATDFLNGPPEVIQMLCENNYLHRIPISIKGLTNAQKENISKEIEKGLNLVKYVSYDELYTMNRSAYGKRQIFTNIKSFRLKSTIFVNGLSNQQKENINQYINRLQEEAKQIEEKKVHLADTLKDVKHKATEKEMSVNNIDKDIKSAGDVNKAIERLKQRKSIIEDKMLAKKKLYKSLKSNNNLENKNKIFNKIEELLNERLTLQSKDKKAVLIEKVANDDNKMKLQISLIEGKNKSLSINRLNNSIKLEKTERHEKIKEIKAKFKQVNEDYTRTLTAYKQKVSDLTEEDKNEMSIIITEMAENETLNLQGLNSRIEQIKSEIQLNNRSGNENSVRKLQENEEKIQKLSEMIPRLENTVKQHSDNLQKTCDSWEAELDKIIVIISNDFGHNMGKIASAGDVKLDKSDTDYNKWRLIIQVSFRDNEPLTEFNGAQHSGGEKSTTTAIFLNSLQGLTNTPFRVVDEINQGMDARNERRAHELIVQRATGKNSSQYFLITPKLLGGLYYGGGKSMAVHCIFAGRWLPLGEGQSKFAGQFLEMGVGTQYC